MKLDRLKLAELIGYCANRGMTVDKVDVIAIDSMIEVNILEAQEPYKTIVEPIVVNELLKSMSEGRLKVEAIKHYRSLTGMGLKESKDAIEKYWKDK